MNYYDAINAMCDQAEKNISKYGEQEFNLLIKVMIEELGELTKAHLEHLYEGAPAIRIIQEAIDLGSVCLQFNRSRYYSSTITIAKKRYTDVQKGFQTPVKDPFIALLNKLDDLSMHETYLPKQIIPLGIILSLCGDICEQTTL